MENLLDNPPIIVILTTYKRSQLIKRAIRSVLNQTYPHFKLCIYDNASNDGTKEAVLPFLEDKRVHYHCHQENIGMMANYQYAFSKISSPFFCFFSDDDILLPTFLEKAIKGFEVAPEAGFFIGSTIIVTEKRKIINIPINHWKAEGKLLPSETISEMVKHFPPPTSFLFRVEVLEKAALDIFNQIVWDIDFLLQVATYFPCFISKEIMGIFVSHEGSFTSSQLKQQWTSGFDRLTQRLEEKGDFPKKIKETLQQGLLEYRKSYMYGLVSHYFLKQKFQDSYLCAIGVHEQYGGNFKNSLLKIFAKICQYFPFLFPVLRAIHSLKKIKKYYLRFKFRAQTKLLAVE